VVTAADRRFVARVDMAWPDRRLALEADGVAWHGDPAALHTDRARQNALAVLGWTTLRTTWADTYEPQRLVEVVRRALAATARRV
jgi:very-short-patch-repair endonuclease